MDSEKPESRLPKRPEEFEGLPPSPSWPTFIEKLLLALIDAHPGDPNHGGAKTPQDARNRRLGDALRILLGVEEQPGATEEFDLPRLMEIARRRLRQVGLRDFAKAELELNDEEMAGLGASANHGRFADDVRATGDDTRSAVNKDRVRLGKKFKADAFQDYAFHILTFRDHEEERAMLNDLERIQEILARWNTRIKIDPLALGMASLTYATTPD